MGAGTPTRIVDLLDAGTLAVSSLNSLILKAW